MTSPCVQMADFPVYAEQPALYNSEPASFQYMRLQNAPVQGHEHLLTQLTAYRKILTNTHNESTAKRVADPTRNSKSLI